MTQCIHCCTQNARFKEFTNSKNLFCGFKCQMSHYGIGLKIELMDGIEEFEDELVENSKTLKNLIEDAGTEETIPLPLITRAVFLQIVAFLKNGTLPKDEALFPLLEAANYLDIEKLYDKCVRWVIPTMMKLPNVQNLFASYPLLKQIILEAAVLYSSDLYFNFDRSQFSPLKKLIQSFPDIEKKKIEPFLQAFDLQDIWKLAIDLNAATIYVKTLTDNELLHDIILYAMSVGNKQIFNLVLDNPNFEFNGDQVPLYIVRQGFTSLALKKRKLPAAFLFAAATSDYYPETLGILLDELNFEISEKDYMMALDVSYSRNVYFNTLLHSKRFKDSVKLKILLKKEFYSDKAKQYTSPFDLVLYYMEDVDSRVFRNFLTENADELKVLILRLKSLEWMDRFGRMRKLEKIEQMLDEKKNEGVKRLK